MAKRTKIEPALFQCPLCKKKFFSYLERAWCPECSKDAEGADGADGREDRTNE